MLEVVSSWEGYFGGLRLTLFGRDGCGGRRREGRATTRTGEKGPRPADWGSRDELAVIAWLCLPLAGLGPVGPQ